MENPNTNIDAKATTWYRDKPGERPLIVHVSLPEIVRQAMLPNTLVGLSASIRCARLSNRRDDNLHEDDLRRVSGTKE